MKSQPVDCQGIPWKSLFQVSSRRESLSVCKMKTVEKGKRNEVVGGNVLKWSAIYKKIEFAKLYLLP